jgi:PAS domain S-box-containing protein
MSIGSSVRVLHIDDEPSFADMVATFLEREHDQMSVQTATNPTDGLQQLAAHDIDCIVSDYDMPGIDGIEFLAAVREDYPELPFILYTGKGSEEIASDAISAGVTDYLQKETGSSQYTVLANRISNAVNQYRSRQAVQETERRLSELAEQTDDILFMFNGDWSELLFINSAYEKIWGGSMDDLEENPTSFLDLIHPEDQEKARASMEKLSAGEPSQLEYRVVSSDGELRWVQGDTKPIQDEDGTVVRIVGLVRDITEQKERELQLETIIHNLPGYVYRHGYDPEYPLKFVKGDAEHVTGYTATELEDQVIQAEEIIHPEDRDGLWSNHIKGLEASGRFDSTYRIITKDDDVRWIRDQGQLIENPVTGEKVIDGFITDISDEIQREQQLRDQQMFIEESLDALQDAFFAVTMNGELRRWNERVSAVSGYADEELDGMDVTELFVEEHRERITESIEEIMQTGSSVVQADILTADGERRSFEFRGTRLTDPLRDEIVAVGIGREISK